MSKDEKIALREAKKWLEVAITVQNKQTTSAVGHGRHGTASKGHMRQQSTKYLADCIDKILAGKADTHAD